MTGGSFQAIFSIVDKVSGPMRGITAAVHRAAQRIGAEHLIPASAGDAARKVVHGIRHSFEHLEGTIKSTIESIGKFLPAVGALGAAGSLTGIVDMVHNVAEARVEVIRAAEKIGIATSALAGLNAAAKLSEIPVESMQGGLTKLNWALGLAASGKNKDVAGLFAHIGISMRDAGGHIRKVDELMPLLADKFKATTDPAMRARMAVTLFGKSGQDLLPMLLLGGDALRDLAGEAKRLGGHLTDLDDQNLTKFQHAWVTLGMAVNGVVQRIGADLAPVLTPIIEHMRDWIVANQAFISEEVTGKIHAIAEVLREIVGIDWTHPVSGMHDLAMALLHAQEPLGGLWYLIGGFALLLGSPLIIAASSAVTAIGTITAAFTTLGAFFLTNPLGLAIAAAVLLGAAAYEVYENWSGIKAFFLDVWNGITSRIESAWPVIQILVNKISFLATPFVDAWKISRDLFLGIWEAIRVGLGSDTSRIQPMLDHFRDAAKDLTDAWSHVGVFFNDLLDGVAAAFNKALVIIKPIIDALKDAANFMAHPHMPNLGSGPGVDQGTFDGNSFGLPLAPAPSAPNAAPQGGEPANGKVHVSFDNAPPGTRVQSTGRGVTADVGGFNLGMATA